MNGINETFFLYLMLFEIDPKEFRRTTGYKPLNVPKENKEENDTYN